MGGDISVWSLVLGGGGATFLWTAYTIVKNFMDGAAKKETEAALEVKRWHQSNILRAEFAERWGRYWYDRALMDERVLRLEVAPDKWPIYGPEPQRPMEAENV